MREKQSNKIIRGEVVDAVGGSACVRDRDQDREVRYLREAGIVRLRESLPGWSKNPWGLHYSHRMGLGCE